jgi:hypothetical protein
MDATAVLALYDEQVRRRTDADEPGATVEADERVVRHIAPAPGWNAVTYSQLVDVDVEAVIAEQIRRFAGARWEWKHYSHDLPADLPQRLRAAGLVAGEPETLLVLDLAAGAPASTPPAGVQLRTVTDAAGVRALAAVQEEAFGHEGEGLTARLLASLAQEPLREIALLALADGEAVAGGRVEQPPGSSFAGLWGGATRTRWRRRGIYGALVGARAELARERGHRFLHVDALAQSQPVLRRLGFVELAVTTPFRPAADAA